MFGLIIKIGIGIIAGILLAAAYPDIAITINSAVAPTLQVISDGIKDLVFSMLDSVE